MAIRRRPVLVEFEDQFGDKQVIHRGSGSRLAIRRREPTVALAMSRAVGRLVGQRIHEERLKAGLTMPALASRAGLKGGKQSIYHIEQALSTGVRLGTLYAIATALDVPLFSLLPDMSTVLRDAGAQLRNEEQLAV